MHTSGIWFAFVYNGLTYHRFLTLGPHQNEFVLLRDNSKNCNKAGRASEMHSVSMRSVVEGSEPVGNQQTSLELCTKPPPFLASSGPSAVWLDTQSTTLLPGDPRGWPYGGDLCYWDNIVGTKLVYPNNIRVFLLGTGYKAISDAF